VQLLQPYLDDSRQGIRKRALHCIGTWVANHGVP
jgi:hypothetical protein